MAFTPTFNSFRRTLVVWLAVWTAVFGALAPTVSHAVAWSQGGAAPLTEVCTDAGMRWVDSSTGQTSMDSPDVHEADTEMAPRHDRPRAPGIVPAPVEGAELEHSAVVIG